MTDDLRGPTERALDLLRDGLRTFVEDGLKDHFVKISKNWIEAFEQYRNAVLFDGKPKDRQDRLPRLGDQIVWTPDELLKTISSPLWFAFQFRFKERQRRSADRRRKPDAVARGWVDELIEIRNAWAHRTADDCKRFLDTSERLLKSVGEIEAAERMRHLLPSSRPSIAKDDQPRSKDVPFVSLRPNATIQKMLSRLPQELSLRWRQTAIDGAFEVFSCPDGSGSYGGLDFEYIVCDAQNKEWPQDFGGLSAKQSGDMATSLIGDDQAKVSGWLTQKGKPGRIRVLLAPIDPPNLDRPYIHVEIGNSDYFTARTLSELGKYNLEGRGPDLYSIFSEGWAKPGSRFTTNCVPYHASIQGVVLCRTARDGDYLLLGSVNPQNPSITDGWGATMAEQMWAPDAGGLTTEWWRPYAAKRLANIPIPPKRSGDPDLRETLRRGLHEELGIILGVDTLQNPRLVSVAIEDNFFITFIFVVIVGLELEDVFSRWKSAPDHNELGLLAAYKFSGVDANGASLSGPERFANILSGDAFDAGPHLLPSPQQEGKIVGKWHCSSRLRIYAAGMHLWPNHFSSYVKIET